LLLGAAVVCQASGDPVAARLANQAKKALESGETVRAYLLYAEAFARDPQNASYRMNRDELQPAAMLLTKAHVQTADISQDIAIAKAEKQNPAPPIERISTAEWEQDPKLQPPPQVLASNLKADFNLHGPAKTVLEQVATVYGVKTIIDPDLRSTEPIHFELTQADFRTAMQAVTVATGTFVFAASPHIVYFAPDTEAKREQLEPTILLTFHLPDALSEKDLIEAANVVRNLLQLKAVGWDSQNRMVVIRDRITRARIARSVLQALLLPRAQVEVEVKFLTVDTDKKYTYGAQLQTSFPAYFLGHIGGFTSVYPSISSTLLLLGGGGSLFGLGLADATFLAQYSNAYAQTIYDATVAVGDRQTANFHVGDKYPIAQTLYTGYTQGEASIYNPTPQITLVDLGLVLKITPYVNGDGDIALDLEAEYNALGTQVVDSIPSIADRVFKGTVNLREGQEAILAGLDSNTISFNRTGLFGIMQIPGLNEILTQTTRERQTSQTLIVVKPTITRLPMASWISPQYLYGPQHGERVLL
jgi:general secretion pathway protein D